MRCCRSTISKLPGALRRQVPTAGAAPSCRCGCGSIYLLIDHDASVRAESLGERVIAEGDVLNEIGEPVGGLLLFQDDGWLNNLEVYSMLDEPLPLPAVARTRLRLYR